MPNRASNATVKGNSSKTRPMNGHLFGLYLFERNMVGSSWFECVRCRNEAVDPLQRRVAVGVGDLSCVPLVSPVLRAADYITDCEGSRQRGLVVVEVVEVVDVVDVVRRERKLGIEGNKSKAW
jgi:hypothetical protein